MTNGTDSEREAEAGTEIYRRWQRRDRGTAVNKGKRQRSGRRQGAPRKEIQRA